LLYASVFSQKRVEFSSADSLLITADLYETENDTKNFIILLHQAEYSRGEYKEIATRLIKLGFNCLAIDMRSGGEVNYVRNETAIRAKDASMNTSFLECQKDIDAALAYTKTTFADPEITLFGSSFSAALALLTAVKDTSVKAVIAFSPGEFFEPEISVAKSLPALHIPCYIASPKSEYPYIEKLTAKMPKDNVVIYTPERGDGLHGAKTLWWESSTRNEFWLSLLFFLNDIKDE